MAVKRFSRLEKSCVTFLQLVKAVKLSKGGKCAIWSWHVSLPTHVTECGKFYFLLHTFTVCTRHRAIIVILPVKQMTPVEKYISHLKRIFTCMVSNISDATSPSNCCWIWKIPSPDKWAELHVGALRENRLHSRSPVIKRLLVKRVGGISRKEISTAT